MSRVLDLRDLRPSYQTKRETAGFRVAFPSVSSFRRFKRPRRIASILGDVNDEKSVRQRIWHQVRDILADEKMGPG